MTLTLQQSLALARANAQAIAEADEDDGDESEFVDRADHQEQDGARRDYPDDLVPHIEDGWSGCAVGDEEWWCAVCGDPMDPAVVFSPRLPICGCCAATAVRVCVGVA